MTLAKLAALARSDRAPNRSIEVAFVTIDPTRDTVSTLHRFIRRFTQRDGRFVVGLTGTAAQIARVKAAYHIWSQPLANGDIAHTAAIIIIDARGRIAGIFDDDQSPASLSRALSAVWTS